MKKLPYGPCGLYCGACGAPDCEGCQSTKIDEYVKQCKFRECAMGQDLEFCCFCSDYPCSDMQKFMSDKWPHHWTIENNLEYIRKHGKEKWLQNQEKEWSCKSCSSEINWYQKVCKCGQSISGWDLPA